jgi:hypothetical protein
MLGLAGVLRSGAANPRFAYLPIDPAYPGAVAFARALGAIHHLELDATIDGQLVECHRLDYGPGGLLAALRAQVYIELGLPPPAPAPVPTPVPTPAPDPGKPYSGSPDPGNPPASARHETSPAGDVQAVRQALRDFQVPRDLARNPLAFGDSVQERAESVRLLIRDAAREAFGESENEKLLHSVLIAGYLEPLRSHEDAASRLCMSRAAYFRRLRTAVERLAEHIASDSASGPASDSTTAGTAQARRDLSLRFNLTLANWADGQLCGSVQLSGLQRKLTHASVSAGRPRAAQVSAGRTTPTTGRKTSRRRSRRTPIRRTRTTPPP